jgi:hypothetical protein
VVLPALQLGEGCRVDCEDCVFETLRGSEAIVVSISGSHDACLPGAYIVIHACMQPGLHEILNVMSRCW